LIREGKTLANIDLMAFMVLEQRLSGLIITENM